jgi:hypothetical protein
MTEVISPQAGPSAAVSDLGLAFARLARISLGNPFGAVLYEIARVAAGVIPGADDVCLAVLDRGRAVGVEFAGRRLGVALDERLYPLGYGPAFGSACTGRSVLIRDTSRADGHREFARLAHDHGVAQVLAVPLPLAGSAVPPGDTAGDVRGSLTVYAAAGAIDEATVATAERFAEGSAVTVSNAVLYVAAELHAAQLQEAMASRAVIEQAKGVIMATEKCSAESAFGRLRDASMRSHRKLRDIAASIVAGAST